MKALVGYTGFVGSNLAAHGNFDGLYNSKNVKEAYGTNPDILYYSGVPAAKFIANKFPEMDMAIMRGAVENIRKINPKKLVLISTVDVYKEPNGKDEDSIMDTDGLEAYGKVLQVFYPSDELLFSSVKHHKLGRQQACQLVWPKSYIL